MNRALLLFLLLIGLLAACKHVTVGAPAPSYTLVFIKTGPQSGKLSKEANQEAFAGHFANMQRLAEERHLLVAGPFGPQRADPTLRGIFVLDTSDRAQAEEWAGTDPTTRAGVFTLEFHDLATTYPLHAVLEGALAREASEKAAGRTPKPGDGCRQYVFLTVEDGARAREELADLVASGGVLMLADLDRTRAFAILDAKDLDSARALLGPRLERLGECALNQWFGTDLLARTDAP